MADLLIEDRPGLAIATIQARKGVTADAIGERLGVALRDAPGWTGDASLRMIGTGPGVWLAIADPAPDPWAAMLRDRLAGLASVSDQSGGYGVLRLSGTHARRLLQRGLPVDLHPARFAPGSAAVSVIAHIGVVLWQLDDTPGYEIATFRSYAESFRRWLDWPAAGRGG